MGRVYSILNGLNGIPDESESAGWIISSEDPSETAPSLVLVYTVCTCQQVIIEFYSARCVDILE